MVCKFMEKLTLAFALSLAGCSSEISEATRQLQADDPAVRKQGARKLAETSEDTRESLPVLVDSLKDADPEVRRLAAQALGRLGPDGKEATEALVARLDDPERSVQMVAASALVKIDPENNAPVALLAKFAEQGDPRSINALGQLGATAAPAVPALIRALRSNSTLVQIQAIHALEKIGPPAKESLPALKRFKPGSNPDLQEAAAKAIAVIEG